MPKVVEQVKGFGILSRCLVQTLAGSRRQDPKEVYFNMQTKIQEFVGENSTQQLTTNTGAKD